MLTAIAVIWKRLVGPLIQFVLVAQDLTRELKDTPEAFAILREIIAQFRTDSGSSLRDVVNRLETAAEASALAINTLTEGGEDRRRQASIEQEASRLLAQEDRTQIARLVVALERVDAKVLAAAHLAEGVAIDLEESHARAEESTSDEAGAAADAAMQRPPADPA